MSICRSSSLLLLYDEGLASRLKIWRFTARLDPGEIGECLAVPLSWFTTSGSSQVRIAPLLLDCTSNGLAAEAPVGATPVSEDGLPAAPLPGHYPENRAGARPEVVDMLAASLPPLFASAVLAMAGPEGFEPDRGEDAAALCLALSHPYVCRPDSLLRYHAARARRVLLSASALTSINGHLPGNAMPLADTYPGLEDCILFTGRDQVDVSLRELIYNHPGAVYLDASCHWPSWGLDEVCEEIFSHPGPVHFLGLGICFMRMLASPAFKLDRTGLLLDNSPLKVGTLLAGRRIARPGPPLPGNINPEGVLVVAAPHTDELAEAALAFWPPELPVALLRQGAWNRYVLHWPRLSTSSIPPEAVDPGTVPPNIPVSPFYRLGEQLVPVLVLHPKEVNFDTLVEIIAMIRVLGFQSVTYEDLACFVRGTELPPRPILIDVDHAGACVGSRMAPLFERCGLRATLFVDTRRVESWLMRGFPFQERPSMTWDEIASLAAKGWHIGSHTHTHPDLAKVAPERLKQVLAQETDTADAILTDRLGLTPHDFAYTDTFWDPLADEVVRNRYRFARIWINGETLNTLNGPLPLPRLDTEPGYLNARTPAHRIPGMSVSRLLSIPGGLESFLLRALQLGR